MREDIIEIIQIEGIGHTRQQLLGIESSRIVHLKEGKSLCSQHQKVVRIMRRGGIIKHRIVFLCKKAGCGFGLDDFFSQRQVRITRNCGID